MEHCLGICTDVSRKPSIREKFPPPWQVRDLPEVYSIEAANGRRIASVYFEDVELRRSILNIPTRAEAHAIAKAIAGLPSLMDRARGRDGGLCHPATPK